MKTMLWTISCAIIVGCATTDHVDPETMQTATAPLICANSDECARWWQRAHEWISRHGGYPIRTATETLLETAGPGGGSRKLAYQITKTANDDGTSLIGFTARCDSRLGCRPDPWKAAAKFKQFVKTGAEPAETPTPTAPAIPGPSAAIGTSALPPAPATPTGPGLALVTRCNAP